MAGLGRRVFTPGEVLTATNVMGYLQDQAVMNFAGTAARGSAIGTAVAEGMVSYLADSNVVQAYDGSAWNSLAYQSAVSAIPRVGAIPLVPTSVAVGSGSGSYDSTTGLVTFTSASSITVNGVFSSTYKNYKIFLNVTSSSATAVNNFRYATTGTATTSGLWYVTGGYWGINGAGTSSASSAITDLAVNVSLGSGYNNTTSMSEITLTNNRVVANYAGFPNNAGGSLSYGLWNELSPTHDGFRIQHGSGNFTGTLKIYGFN